ncbi:MAG: hypothetical protein J2P50_09040 [Hyphomicrobiaceae bacterium]|nr:hypothetical protein [Hyphomicrobiaceae bacterium]
MGVDWVLMSPLPGVARSRLEEMIEQQAAAFRASGCGLYDEFRFLDRAAAYNEEVVDPGPLADYVEYATEADGDPVLSWRVGAVVVNQVLPAEWRYAAQRSFLPDQILDAVAIWSTHLEEVRAGHHRAHLYAWYRYSTELEFAQVWWRDLRDRAMAARERHSRWAAQPDLVGVREQILGGPELPVSPPRWSEECTVPEDDGTYDAAFEMLREWNRRVPRKHRVGHWRHGPRQPFEAFVKAWGDNEWTWECLAWLQQAANEGRGVILDF